MKKISIVLIFCFSVSSILAYSSRSSSSSSRSSSRSSYSGSSSRSSSSSRNSYSSPKSSYSSSKSSTYSKPSSDSNRYKSASNNNYDMKPMPSRKTESTKSEKKFSRDSITKNEKPKLNNSNTNSTYDRNKVLGSSNSTKKLTPLSKQRDNRQTNIKNVTNVRNVTNVTHEYNYDRPHRWYHDNSAYGWYSHTGFYSWSTNTWFWMYLFEHDRLNQQQQQIQLQQQMINQQNLNNQQVKPVQQQQTNTVAPFDSKMCPDQNYFELHKGNCKAQGYGW